MKYLKAFEANHYMNVGKQLDLIQIYSDCFQDILDMDGIIYLSVPRESNYNVDYVDIKDIDKIKEVLDKKESGVFSEIEITILFISDKSPDSNRHGQWHDNMLSVYEHLKKSLQSDENKFRDASGAKIWNIFTRIDVKTVENRDDDMKHPSIISYWWDGYTIDPTNKPKHGIVRRFKAFMNGRNYNFPEIHQDDSIFKIEIKHEIRL